LLLRQWGWSQESVAEALNLAKRRVAELTTRLAGGVGPDVYLYGARQPLREEIVRYLGSEDDRPPDGIVTRNRYGALVLNTARVPFIDVDAVQPTGFTGLKRLFGGGSATDPTLERIRAACARHPQHGFRVYRTHSGFRLLVVNAALDPVSEEAATFMKDFAADPHFMMLCKLQKSFRARLTPKPWRMGVPAPPGEHPRDPAPQAAFGTWLLKYELAARGYASARFVEAIGPALPASDARVVIDEHDRTARVTENLPLA
jgi:hypothetical protein